MDRSHTDNPGSLWNRKTFPSFDKIEEDFYLSGIPELDHHTAFVGQIVRDVSLGRVTLSVSDSIGTGKRVTVAFYDPSSGRVFSPLARPGNTIVILYPKKYQFMDGQEGFRIEDDDMKYIRIIPHEHMSLVAATDVFYQVTTNPKGKACQNCETFESTLASADPPRNLLSCARCITIKYCSKECQVAHWPTHKKYCKILVEAKWFTTKDWAKVEQADDGSPVRFTGYDE